MEAGTLGDIIVALYAFGVVFGRLFPKTADALIRDARDGHLFTPGGRT